MKKTFFIACSCLLLSLPSWSQKKEKDASWRMRLRGIAVIPQESADIGIIGGDIDVATSIVPELDFTYFFTKNIAAELILGTTRHKVHTVGSNLTAIGGSPSTNVDLGKVWLLPPTLTVQYHFPLKAWKPYIGAGINYTIFYGVDEGDVVKGIDYENKVGFAMQAGCDYDINKKWFINVDVKKILLSSDVTVDASNLAAGLSIPADVQLDPWIIGVGIGIKF